MKLLYGWPKYLKPNPTHYCPGCGHSVVHRLIAELLEEADRARDGEDENLQEPMRQRHDAETDAKQQGRMFVVGCRKHGDPPS